jgi:hypothetical protein
MFLTTQDFIDACKENKIRLIPSKCVVEMEKFGNTWEAAGMSLTSAMWTENIPSTPTEEAEYGK